MEEDTRFLLEPDDIVLVEGVPAPAGLVGVAENDEEEILPALDHGF